MNGGHDAAITFEDGSILIARVLWVDDVDGLAYALGAFAPAHARWSTVRSVRVIRR